MRWQRAGNMSTLQKQVSKEEEFLMLIPLVLQESSNMEPTCVAHIQKCTYIKAVWFAEFIFSVLIKVQDLDYWNCLNRRFLDSLPYKGLIQMKLNKWS